MHLVRAEKDVLGTLNQALANPVVATSLYTNQLNGLRNRAIEDKDHFYTYSEQYMSLSVDPYTLEERRKKHEAEQRKKYLVAKGFETVINKEESEHNRHRQYLHEASVDDLVNNPYHKQKERTKEMLEPKNDLGKADFVRYLQPMKGTFNTFEEKEEDKMTALQAQKWRDELKNKEKFEFKKKLVVADPNFHVGLKPIGIQVLDKYKGLLSDKPLKPGLALPSKYTKDKIVKRDAVLQPLPISFNLDEQKLTKAEAEKLIRIDRKFNERLGPSDRDFELVAINSQPSMVYKPSRADAFTHKYT